MDRSKELQRKQYGIVCVCAYDAWLHLMRIGEPRLTFCVHLVSVCLYAAVLFASKGCAFIEENLFECVVHVKCLQRRMRTQTSAYAQYTSPQMKNEAHDPDPTICIGMMMCGSAELIENCATVRTLRVCLWSYDNVSSAHTSRFEVSACATVSMWVTDSNGT